MDKQPVLLDLFCGAGGASMGYYKAGFYVIGIDINSQPSYPFDDFIQADWKEPLRLLPGMWERDGIPFAIHASPPCQAYTWGTRSGREDKFPDLIGEVREELSAIGCSYVIENVPGSPLVNPLMLCGQMFGLGVIRHRLFETNLPLLLAPAHPKHNNLVKSGKAVTVAGHGGDNVKGGGSLQHLKDAMDIQWVNSRKELSEMIPPAYTYWIGRQLIEIL